MTVRGGEYAIYNGEEVWVANVGGKEGMALIVHEPDTNPKAEWVDFTLVTKPREEVE